MLVLSEPVVLSENDGIVIRVVVLLIHQAQFLSHLKYEPVVQLVQYGILRKISVFLQHVENENSTVLLRRNVSQDEPPVKLLTLVSMMVSVVVMRVVSVLIVSTDEQMIRISVVS